jgi:L-aminopeptidase/D-esterase-like protein
MSNSSGDYVIAFSTRQGRQVIYPMSPLFQAILEATEEAIYNSVSCNVGHQKGDCARSVASACVLDCSPDELDQPRTSPEKITL